MNTFKIILVSILLLSNLTAKAEDISNTVNDYPNEIGSNISLQQQPTYSGNLFGNNAYTDPMYLDYGTYAIVFIFYGNSDPNHLYSLGIDSNFGSHMYVDFAGQHYISIQGNSVVQLSFSDECGNCSWQIIRIA